MRRVTKLGYVQKKANASPVHSNEHIHWLLMYSDLRNFGFNPYMPEFAARTIEQYRFQAGFHGQAAAKSMVVYDAAANVEANGVNGTLAARVATAAVNEYDRLGAKVSEAQGNPWRAIHAPLMEYSELLLERETVQ